MPELPFRITREINGRIIPALIPFLLRSIRRILWVAGFNTPLFDQSPGNGTVNGTKRGLIHGKRSFAFCLNTMQVKVRARCNRSVRSLFPILITEVGQSTRSLSTQLPAPGGSARSGTRSLRTRNSPFLNCSRCLATFALVQSVQLGPSHARLQPPLRNQAKPVCCFR